MCFDRCVHLCNHHHLLVRVTFPLPQKVPWHARISPGLPRRQRRVAQCGARLAPGSSSHRVAAVSTVGPRGARGPPLRGGATLVCPALLSMDIRLPLFQEALNRAAANIRTCLCVGHGLLGNGKRWRLSPVVRPARVFISHGEQSGWGCRLTGSGHGQHCCPDSDAVSGAHQPRAKVPVGPRAHEHLLLSDCFIFATESVCDACVCQQWAPPGKG